MVPETNGGGEGGGTDGESAAVDQDGRVDTDRGVARNEDRPTPDGWTQGSVRANGIEVSYYRVGDRDGQPVVAAHGFYDDARCMRPVVDALAADGFDVVAYDARGHGHTDAPEAGYAIADRVADLVGVLDALDLADPVLYGHSMGGHTVATTAARQSERVRAVVMEDPAAMYGLPDEDPDAMAEYVREQVRAEHEKSLDELREQYVEEHPETADWLARADQCMSVHIENVPRQGYPPLAGVFPDVDAPALVLKRDPDAVEAEATERAPVRDRARDLDVAADLPDGRLVHVPDAGHAVVRDEPEVALAEVRAFLRRLDDGDW
ncbi:alpha/beta fold hydrolase [Halorubellus sp. JP-L1]|uniref:alpha/beta fold hydrolase n=1 Tax=Halorubellus sp. JP-L1 TaxID=2715753 RepID=UPI001409413F|nr:alpha/beta hydrolase [Halorubellus sp. JP-L1]NHN42385.1 alpha/beta fold hydrolase [Halorubellus sp. JP-L1]